MMYPPIKPIKYSQCSSYRCHDYLCNIYINIVITWQPNKFKLQLKKLAYTFNELNVGLLK